MAFALIAAVALGLGIETTTAISALFRRPCSPVPVYGFTPAGNVQVHDLDGRPGGRTAYTIPEFLDVREQAHSFDRIIAADQMDVLYITRGPSGCKAKGGSTNAFQALGMKPVLDRYITPEDGKPDAPAVFVMSYNNVAEHVQPGRVDLGETLQAEWTTVHADWHHAAAVYVRGFRSLAPADAEPVG